jgi:hypothetical protein
VRPGRRLALAGVCLVALVHAAKAAAVTWREDFASGRLDATRWQRTVEGDFRTDAAEIVAAGTPARHRLRLLVDTLGTRDDTIKRMGVGTRCAIPLGPDARLRVRIDWGPPANGSYLAAAVVISPHATAASPEATDDWLSVGYVGVPPGHNARLLVTARTRGVKRTLYADGWPDVRREGRPVKRAEIELAWRGPALEIREDGRLVHIAAASEARFDAAHVYLQLASHSNYPARAVSFEDLPAAPACDASPQ